MIGKMPENGGVPIVLTASTIEMSDFNLNPFIAFSGGFPNFLVRKKLYISTVLSDQKQKLLVSLQWTHWA
jgi:hypothetical protein